MRSTPIIFFPSTPFLFHVVYDGLLELGDHKVWNKPVLSSSARDDSCYSCYTFPSLCRCQLPVKLPHQKKRGSGGRSWKYPIITLPNAPSKFQRKQVEVGTLKCKQHFQVVGKVGQLVTRLGKHRRLTVWEFVIFYNLLMLWNRWGTRRPCSSSIWACQTWCFAASTCRWPHRSSTTGPGSTEWHFARSSRWCVMVFSPCRYSPSWPSLSTATSWLDILGSIRSESLFSFLSFPSVVFTTWSKQFPFHRLKNKAIV